MVSGADGDPAEAPGIASRSSAVRIRCRHRKVACLHRRAGLAEPLRDLSGYQGQGCRRDESRATQGAAEAGDADDRTGTVHCLSCQPARARRRQNRPEETGTGLVIGSGKKKVRMATTVRTFYSIGPTAVVLNPAST